MKTHLVLILLGLVLISGIIPALAKEIEVPVTFDRRNMSGPRFGVTYVGGHGELHEELERQGIGPVVSQFGWHFERQVIPEGGGPQFVPGGTLAMGIRMPRGWEFGMGPNIVATKNEFDSTKARTSLVVAIGKSINYGGVSIPINLAVSSAPEGNRYSVIFGYAIGKTTKTVEVPDDYEEEKYGSVSNNQWGEF